MIEQLKSKLKELADRKKELQPKLDEIEAKRAEEIQVVNTKYDHMLYDLNYNVQQILDEFYNDLIKSFVEIVSREFNAKRSTEIYEITNLIPVLKGVETLEKLETLWLNANQISKIRGLDNCKNMKILNLKQNNITRIEGLYSLTELENLYLSENNIGEIKGLETLIKLETLDLGQNRIIQIKGLESLTNLKDFWLKDNLIPEKVLEQLGGLDSGGCATDPLKFVKYSLVNL